MKPRSLPCLLAAALCASTAFAQPAAVEPPVPLPTAVFDFQAADRSLEKKGAEVGILLNAALSTHRGVFLVERQEVEKIMGEQEIGLSGTVSPESAAKVGALVGAKVLITGRVFESGGKGYLVSKVIGTETGRVFGDLATAPSLDTLEVQVGVLAGKIADTLTKQSATLVATVEDPGARLERLKKAVTGKKRTAVLVTLPEQHLARPATDPAAQTELMKTLQDVGFEVVTAAGAVGRTDVATIKGEAFSELGMRRGNFVSCRARIEVAVKDASGKLLASDSQMDVGVDISEHIAGKKALAAAALKLADRLVLVLAQ